jgi:hypothetical protein
MQLLTRFLTEPFIIGSSIPKQIVLYLYCIKMRINIAKDFSEFPWPRFKTDGEFSWELFFETILDKKYIELQEWDILEIDLDGTYKYPSSFLSEAFGRFYAKHKDEWWERLKFISNEDPSLIDFISYLAKKYE